MIRSFIRSSALLLALLPVTGYSAGPLILVGGGLKDDNTAIYQRLIQLAGGNGQARIGVITAASIPESDDPDAGTADAANSKANGEFYAQLLETYGAADAQWIPIDLDQISNNSNPQVVAQINSMTGFFFGGGDQSRLTQTLQTATRADSPALAAIRARHNAGAVLAGTSAGTAIMVQGPMVTGGESYDGLRYGVYTTPSGDDLSYDMQGGFGFFNYGLLDTHFSERGRQGRIVRLADHTQVPFAFGVDENTALLVQNNATLGQVEMEVIGENGVFIFDLRNKERGTGSTYALYDVLGSYLTAGDRYRPVTGQFVIASGKTSLRGRERYSAAMTVTTDIFSSPNNSGANGRRKPREFVKVSADLFDSRVTSTLGRTYETNPLSRRSVQKHAVRQPWLPGHRWRQEHAVLPAFADGFPS
uniref:Cyanophycinase n=1 Tax=Pseudomonas anguilliseptica TaxID=53406 RepID=CPHE_PSEAG|nr:RecName: Full=Cyanophycinase; AltName: Full=Extracellular CGPase; Short=CPHEpa; AltName: Full=Extracellular cyanophycinase; Flags: Precursor [Pseudomonas anguilliseptica]AAL40891.1 extracellular cyanophycinase [Pseudomonas anguilliseptica]